MTIDGLELFEYRERARRAVESIGVAAAVLVSIVCKRNPEIEEAQVGQAHRLISFATLAAGYVLEEPQHTKTAARRHVQKARNRLREAVDNAQGFDFEACEAWQKALEQAGRAIDEADRLVAS